MAICPIAKIHACLKGPADLHIFQIACSALFHFGPRPSNTRCCEISRSPTFSPTKTRSGAKLNFAVRKNVIPSRDVGRRGTVNIHPCFFFLSKIWCWCTIVGQRICWYFVDYLLIKSMFHQQIINNLSISTNHQQFFF